MIPRHRKFLQIPWVTPALFAIFSGSFSVGCSAPLLVAESEVSHQMRPMPKPEWPAGTKWKLLAKWRLMIDGGADLWWEIERRDSNRFTTVDSRGCRRTYEDWFTPPLEFRNCEYARVDAIQKPKRTGETWPLELGKSWSYTVSGFNTRGGRWRNKTSACSVESAVEVTIDAGTFDTYKVICESLRVRETWYMSPSLGTFIIYIRDPDGFPTAYFEYVDLEAPK